MLLCCIIKSTIFFEFEVKNKEGGVIREEENNMLSHTAHNLKNRSSILHKFISSGRIIIINKRYLRSSTLSHLKNDGSNDGEIDSATRSLFEIDNIMHAGNVKVRVRNEILTEDKQQDLHRLIHQFTAPALAMALRDRELTLATLAYLYQNDRMDEVEQMLKPFFEGSHYQTRTSKNVIKREDSMNSTESNTTEDYSSTSNSNNKSNTVIPPISWNDSLLTDIQKRFMSERTETLLIFTWTFSQKYRRK